MTEYRMSPRDAAHLALRDAFEAWCALEPCVTVRVELEAGSTRCVMERYYPPAAGAVATGVTEERERHRLWMLQDCYGRLSIFGSQNESDALRAAEARNAAGHRGAPYSLVQLVEVRATPAAPEIETAEGPIEDCPECDGVCWVDIDANDDVPPSRVLCPHCKGTGKVRETEVLPPGEAG